MEHGAGWVHAVLERSAGPHGGAGLWRVPALAERPPDLPLHVPFLPGAPGLVVLSDDSVVGIWPWHDGRAATEPLPFPPLDVLGASAGLEGFGDLGLLAGFAGADEARVRLGLGMERLVEEAVREGWVPGDERLVGPPFPSRELSLTRGDRLRLLVLSSGGVGAGPEVVLLDLPAPPAPREG